MVQQIERVGHNLTYHLKTPTNINKESVNNNDNYFITDNNNNDELNNSYKDYKRKGEISKAHKKLNETKVYFITKSIKKDKKEFTVILPISNFDNLSNTQYGKSMSALFGTFQMRSNDDLNNRGLREGKPGNRPFILEHVLECEGPYSMISKLPKKELYIPEEKEEENTDHLSEEEKIVLASSKMMIKTEVFMLDNGKSTTVSYFVTEHEYDYTFIDNTIFANTSPYLTDPRDLNNFNKTLLDTIKIFKNGGICYLEDLRDTDKKFSKLLKILDLQNITELMFKNTDEVLSKSIIPVFSNQQDAEDLLITVLEELMSNYKLSASPDRYSLFAYVGVNEEYDRPLEAHDDFIGNFYKDLKEFYPIPMGDLDYVDESFNFDSSIKASYPETTINRVKDWLIRHRLIKSESMFRSIYDANHYYPDYADTYMGKKERTVMLSLDIDEKAEEEVTRLKKAVTKADQFLLDELDKTEVMVKVVSMNLGDFLEFWNTNEIKNGELLYIPEAQSLKTPCLPKKDKDGNNESEVHEYKYKNYIPYDSDYKIYQPDVPVSNILTDFPGPNIVDPENIPIAEQFFTSKLPRMKKKIFEYQIEKHRSRPYDRTREEEIYKYRKDRLYEYQQQLRSKSRQDHNMDNYIYEVKNSNTQS
uniref:hypothetical protein n=1 Tax=Halosiphon tomentosus TaxID=64927 RepID=UPI002E795F00|nr:hypothetical protein V2488_pgp082 [Halosiphon tomentosus]WAM63739.1 hypothetical protein [Halosiphon tomentosus]